MSEHNGVRMACPSCTWSCVMHREDEIPPGVNKMVEGVPWRPNCNQPMEPAGSVAAKNGAESLPPAVVGDDIPIEKRLEVIRQAQTEVDQAKDRWDRAKERATDLRKVYDGRVLNLGSIIRRLTQVVATLPLFDAPAEQPPSLIETATLTEFKAVQQRLEAIGFTVTLEQLDSMDFDTYQTVTAFIQARENGGTVAVPECLMAPADEPHEHDDEPAEPQPSRRRRKGQHEARA